MTACYLLYLKFNVFFIKNQTNRVTARFTSKLSCTHSGVEHTVNSQITDPINSQYKSYLPLLCAILWHILKLILI